VEPQEQELAILFADICDSMPLYEESGAVVALTLIAACLDELAETAVAHGGTVVRSKGDDVLCTFADPALALDAAAAMLDVPGSDTTAIHVGIHVGPAIAAREDIYGDAVNVAARMLALAKPGEIVTSAALFNALPDDRRDRLVLLGRRTLKGKQVPMEVYSMVLDEGEATQGIWGDSTGAAASPPETIVAEVVVDLEHEDQMVTVCEGQRFVLGRARRCDLVLAEPCVSREHAWVEVQRGRVTLTDRSSTGTWILDADGAHNTLRRESAALRGHGHIRLGFHPRDRGDAPEIKFRLRQIL
jgi:class 3 adenylate cyclase